VKGGEDDENYLWITKIMKIYCKCRPKLQKLWTYHLSTLGGMKGVDFGFKEILLFYYDDIIDTDYLIKFAEMEEYRKNCKKTEY
jgi:hypothetical protein